MMYILHKRSLSLNPYP